MLPLPLNLTPNPNQAGGYGIQGFAGAFVQQIHGCYHNVVGFPMHRFCEQVEVARLRP